MAGMVFKSFKDLNDYLNEVDMIDLEMVASAIAEEPYDDEEEDHFCRYREI